MLRCRAVVLGYAGVSTDEQDLTAQRDGVGTPIQSFRVGERVGPEERSSMLRPYHSADAIAHQLAGA